MRIIAPITITDAMLYASSITENDTDDAALYNPATAYAVGARVRRTETHRIYEALQASTGATPESNLTGATPKWLEVKATNKWAPFDAVTSTQAAGTTTGGGNAAVLSYTLKPVGIVDSIYLGNLDALTVRIQVADSTGTQRYDKTTNLRLKNSKSARDYCFKPIVRKRDHVAFDLPPYRNPTITITISKPNSAAKVADIVVGRYEELGEIQWKPEVRIRDFSTKDQDKYGNLKFTRRRNSQLLSSEIFVENELLDEVVRLMRLYTATILVFVGDTRFSSTIVFGFLSDFRGTLESPAGSYCNLSIEGLV